VCVWRDSGCMAERATQCWIAEERAHSITIHSTTRSGCGCCANFREKRDWLMRPPNSINNNPKRRQQSTNIMKPKSRNPRGKTPRCEEGRNWGRDLLVELAALLGRVLVCYLLSPRPTRPHVLYPTHGLSHSLSVVQASLDPIQWGW